MRLAFDRGDLPEPEPQEDGADFYPGPTEEWFMFILGVFLLVASLYCDDALLSLALGAGGIFTVCGAIVITFDLV